MTTLAPLPWFEYIAALLGEQLLLRGPVFGFRLCYSCLAFLMFFTRGPAFSLFTGPHKLCQPPLNGSVGSVKKVLVLKDSLGFLTLDSQCFMSNATMLSLLGVMSEIS